MKTSRIVQVGLALLLCHGIILSTGLTAYLICAAVTLAGILLTMTQIGWGWWLSRDFIVSTTISLFWPVLIVALILRWSTRVATPQTSDIPLATAETGFRGVKDSEES